MLQSHQPNLYHYRGITIFLNETSHKITKNSAKAAFILPFLPLIFPRDQMEILHKILFTSLNSVHQTPSEIGPEYVPSPPLVFLPKELIALVEIRCLI